MTLSAVDKPNPKIVIVGTGNMGMILLQGLSNLAGIDLWASDRGPKPLQLESFLDTISYVPCTEIKDLSYDFLAPCDTLILAVKPQNLIDLVSIWVPFLRYGQTSKKFPLVVSILAGVTISQLQSTLGEDLPIVRAMPNVAARVLSGATAYCSSPQVSPQQLNLAHKIFESVGKAWHVQEHLLDVTTGLSGSGPAYLFMIIEALCDGAVKMGMPRHLALDLVNQTVLGAAKLAQETGLHPAVLKDQVTTPAGTTISAIHELEKHGLRAMLISAVCTATKRSSKLSKRNV